VNPINNTAVAISSGAGSDQPQSLLQRANAAIRVLNSAPDANRTFAVARDPNTKRLVILVRDPATGDVLDQLPAENIVKMDAYVGLMPIF
jgi:uncharacterized FlaG/YvyC family protein